jgi:hypothetical protein
MHVSDNYISTKERTAIDQEENMCYRCTNETPKDISVSDTLTPTSFSPFTRLPGVPNEPQRVSAYIAEVSHELCLLYDRRRSRTTGLETHINQ